MRRIIIESLLILLSFFSFNLFGGSTDGFLNTKDIISYIIVSIPHTFLIIYIIWIKRIEHNKYPDIKDDNPKSKINSLEYYGFKSFKYFKYIDIVFTIVLYSFIFIISSTFVYFIQLLPDINFNTPELSKISVPIPLLLLFSLVTGYKEEIFFRSYLLTAFKNAGVKFSTIALISTCLFALLHFYGGIIGVSIALINGFIFCYVFKKTKNVHVIAIAHALYNFTVLVLQSG